MKVGAANNPRMKLLNEIDWIARRGFDFVNLVIAAPGAALESTNWPEVRAALDASGLGVTCQAAPYFPIDNPSPPVRQAALDELRRCIDVAHVLGAPLCATRFLGWPDHMPEAQGYEYYRQLYTILLRHGQERGVQVALENSAHNSHQLKYFREIFHRLPDLKLVYNVGHGNVQTAQSMTRDYLFALADRLAHVQLSDNGGVTNDQLAFGAPARGGLDWPRELRILRSFRYDGTISLEIGGDRRWLLASADLLREWWPQAG